MKKLLHSFSPLLFLASLGAGGTAVAFFAFINYTLPHGKGLIQKSQTAELAQGLPGFIFGVSEIAMAFFIFVHLALTVALGTVFLQWVKTKEAREIWNDPLRSASLVAPLISLTMTMNVLIGPVRYFFSDLANNLQMMMLPGLIAWVLLWLVAMFLEIALLRQSFEKGFDIEKIHFGWLLHPFMLGMITVTGTGIAALSDAKGIADIAMFLSLISGLMGIFLFLIKLFTLFSRHFAREGLPAKQFLPSLLIVIPNVTLYAISAFRLAHYFEKHHGVHLEAFTIIVMVGALAFETWYLAFGSVLLRQYANTHLRHEFHVSQWGLVCPYVAYAVLTSFVFAVFAPHSFVFIWNIFLLAVTVALFLFLLRKQMTCLYARTVKKVHCE